MTKMDIRHGETQRAMSRASLRALAGHGDPGKFGRMFAHLEPLVAPDEALLDLGEAMKDPEADGGGGDSETIPAGFTYLGQFVDHDITLDLTPLEQQEADPLATQNFRTPGLDLDSVYGAGPAIAPYLYDRDARGKITGKLLIGKTEPSGGPFGPVAVGDHDLPRSRFGRAIIGDERNDENLLVAQTHLAFLKLHNVVVDRLRAADPELDAGRLFDEARRLTAWHYQWIVLFDFVERLTEKGLVRRIVEEGRRFYRFRTAPYIPVEFSAAAYRLGHSMVRESYNHNAVFSGAPGSFGPGTLELLFHFTGKSGAILGDRAAEADPGDFPSGPDVFERLPSNWVIDWRRFYDLGAPADEPDFSLNMSRKLDPFIVPALHTLPGEAGNMAVLPFRNLRRGVQLELPSGQDVAGEIARQVPIERLSEDDLANGAAGAAAKAHGLHKASPLWYYILKEAEVMHGGERLGPVGSILIAETFAGLVHGDRKSFMWLRKDWRPELPGAEAGHFTMADMLNLIGELNPVGRAPAAPATGPKPAEPEPA